MCYRVSMTRCWQQRGCRSLWEKRPGLPCAGHSRLLMAPEDPSQDTAQPLSPAGAISRKTYFRKSKTSHTGKGRGVGVKGWETALRRWDQRRRGKRCQICCPSAVPMVEHIVTASLRADTRLDLVLKDCSPVRRAHTDARKELSGWRRLSETMD